MEVESHFTHPLLPPGAIYTGVPETAAPAWSAPKSPPAAVVGEQDEEKKEVWSAQVDFVYPYHRWFSDAGWGTLLVFGGHLRPHATAGKNEDESEDGAEASETKKNKRAKTEQEARDVAVGQPFCAFAFNTTADGLKSTLYPITPSGAASLTCTLKVSNATALDFDALREETKTLGQTPFDFRTFVEWCLQPGAAGGGKIRIVLVDAVDDVQEVKSHTGECSLPLQGQASLQVAHSLNASADGRDDFMRRFVEVQGTGPMEQVVRSLWARPLYSLWQKLQATDQTAWVATHNWWRCFRELDMTLLHWNLAVDYTDLSPKRYTPVSELGADSILFPLYPYNAGWFVRKPLAEDEKGLLIVGDPTGQRTLGEREAYLRAHPHFVWGKPGAGGKGFQLVHQNKSEGIYHFGGSLVPNSAPPAVEICFSFDTTGSMYPYLKEVRKNLKYLVQSLLLDMPFLRIAIIAHGDYCDKDSYVLKRIDFSNDANRLCKFVEEVKGTGGGDEPECYELVLHDAQSLSWTKETKEEEEENDAAGKDTKKKTETMKALVIIGDEEPHEKQDLKGKVEYDWREELAALKAQGIYVYGVQCAKNKNADEFYRTLGEVSGGSHLRLNAIKEMERLIKGLCYRQATDFMAASSEQSTADAAGGQQGEPLSLHPTLEAIHNAVHTPDQKTITVDGVEHELSTTDNAGCRFVQIEGITYIEQNKKKDTIYAEMANQGNKVTWMIGRGKGWGLIVNNRLVKRPAGDEAKTEAAPTEFAAFVEEKTFVKHWQELTQGLLDGLLGPNVCVAGGSVLNCLLNRSLAWETAGTKADIDIFVHGVNKAKATELIRHVLTTITDRLKAKDMTYVWKCKSHTVTLVPSVAQSEEWSCSACTYHHTAKRDRCKVCRSPYAPAEDALGAWTHCPPIQIILYSIGSIDELLSGFDLDCCCIAYDGDKVLCHPRAINAIQKGFNVVDPIRVAPSYSRRLHKYSNRGFAVAVPGLNRDFVDDSLRFVASLKQHDKKISGTNGLLWLLSKERTNPHLKHSGEEDDDDEEVEEDEYKEEGDEEASSDSERSDEEEYSEERDPETGLLMKKSEVQKRDGIEKDKKKKKTKNSKEKKPASEDEDEDDDEENSDDEEYSEERDPDTGLLMKKSEVRARDGVGMKTTAKKKKKLLKPKKESSDDDDDDDDENSDDEEYSEERDPETGLLMKKSEVRRRRRAGDKTCTKKKSGDDDDNDGMDLEDEEEEDEGKLGDRDPVTGILYTRGELKKLIRERAAEAGDAVDADQVVKERPGKTPVDDVVADVTWHTRRSRFELYARFCRDWYWLASATSIGPLLQGYNRWLFFGEVSTRAQGPWPSSRDQVQSFLAFPNTRFSTAEEFEQHFDHMADKLMNEAILLIANRPKRSTPAISRDTDVSNATTTTTTTTTTTETQAMDVEDNKYGKDRGDDEASNDRGDDAVSREEEEEEEGTMTAYRLAEVEFYYWGGALKDVFTHRDDRQRESGRWYFHRDVTDKSLYRTGNFKGLDLTFGNGERKEHVYGGILIRAIERVRDGKLFEGPCVSVDRLLAHAGVKETKDFVSSPSFDFEVGNSGAQVLRQSQLYLHFPSSPRQQQLARRELVKGARVGLSVRRLKPGAGGEHFYTKPYRYQAEPVSRWTKGMQHLVPSLRAQGRDVDAIVRATGVDSSRVNSLLEWCDAGRAMPSADHLFGQTLKGDESVCNLFGYCLEWTRTADAILAWAQEQQMKDGEQKPDVDDGDDEKDKKSKKDKGFTLEEIVFGLGQSDVRSKDKAKQCAQWLSSEGKLCLRKD